MSRARRIIMAIPLPPAHAALESASPAMRGALRVLATVAPHDVPVLLLGESGSGKSMLARALHAASPRRERPFVSVDCLELSGGPPEVRVLHERIAAAADGTVLFEEIAALPEVLQGAVLALFERSASVRVVASTRRDLDAEVRAGRFREDLRSRLDLVEIRVPPLRARREDILALASSFLAAFAETMAVSPPALTPAAEQVLLAYPWPGNVRELRNAMQHAVVVAGGSTLDVDALPVRLRGGR